MIFITPFCNYLSYAQWNGEWGMPFMCSLNMPTLCFILLEFTLWQLEKSISPITVQTFSTSSNVHYSISCLFRSPKTNADPPLYFPSPLPTAFHIFIIKMLQSFATKLKLATSDGRRSGNLQPKIIFLEFFYNFIFYFSFALMCVCEAERALAMLWQNKIKHQQ